MVTSDQVVIKGVLQCRNCVWLRSRYSTIFEVLESLSWISTPQGVMGVYKNQVLLCIGAILLSREVCGLGLQMFTAKHRTAIQEYIMSGYGDGWERCDILSANLDKGGFYI